MTDFSSGIVVLPDFIPEDVCDMLVDRFENNIGLAKRNVPNLSFTATFNNLDSYCILLNNHVNNNPDIKKIDDIIFQYVAKGIQEINSKLFELIKDVPDKEGVGCYIPKEVMDTGYKFHKFVGATHFHVDGARPKLKPGTNDYVRMRLGAIVMIVSDTEDSIIFPLQSKVVKYKKGMMLFFPPYWTHPHYTQYGGGARYAIVTWLENDNLLGV